jgi:molecular chaperone GrpE
VSTEPNQPQAEAPPVEEAPAAAEAESPSADGADSPPVDPVADAEARAAEYLDMAKRKQAEFENFRKRMAVQVAQAEDRGVAKLAKELLPALDHLERALQAAEAHAGADEWVKGIRLVQDEVTGALGRAGIQAFAPIGDPFDPNEHEAMAQQPVEGAEPGTVAQVYQAGYRLNGAVLRPARVVVAS